MTTPADIAQRAPAREAVYDLRAKIPAKYRQRIAQLRVLGYGSVTEILMRALDQYCESTLQEKNPNRERTDEAK